MRIRLAMAALIVCAWLPAQQTLTVDQLLSFVRSAIKLKQPDKEVAAYLSKLKLSEKLDERTIEDLQGEGAGPKTAAALSQLAAASASLAKPQPKAPKPPPPPIPPPSPEEQQEIIAEAREYASNYSKKLPDFICTEVTRKYVDPSGLEFWQTQDTITARLTYFEQKENYKVTLVNDRYVDLPYDAVGGASSTGDFGSLLRSTLSPKTDALMEFDHWATLRGKRTYVFSYRISSANSDYSIDWQRQQHIIIGYRGLIYVDKDADTERARVLRITMEAIDIPPTFPVQQASTILDYDNVKIGDREFVLPLKAEVRMRHDKYLTKNVKEFRLYRRFSADATVTFDTPEPLPEDQTKEQQPPK
jgi:hypothetical protein